MLKIDEHGTKIMPDSLRIHWKPIEWEWRAEEDRKIFKAWLIGKLSTAQATEKLAKGNDTVITERQFLANAEWLGYIRRKKK